MGSEMCIRDRTIAEKGSSEVDQVGPDSQVFGKRVDSHAFRTSTPVPMGENAPPLRLTVTTQADHGERPRIGEARLKIRTTGSTRCRLPTNGSKMLELAKDGAESLPFTFVGGHGEEGK